MASEDDITETEELIFETPSLTLFKDTVDAVCGKIHWPTYRNLPAADRMNGVISRTQEVNDRVMEKRYELEADTADSD
jgi:hypothetical protein